MIHGTEERLGFQSRAAHALATTHVIKIRRGSCSRWLARKFSKKPEEGKRWSRESCIVAVNVQRSKTFASGMIMPTFLLRKRLA